ncbi:hypothetical protein ASD64_09075 [Mesorhizobium sp. Root157]|uniref:hypothetical protein n=1 Tax=Mesorhizobium sp. Root157 TaxID=1736477 RepID=UPI0006F7FBE4|nr:hypothetical protein [Mesorhizobium sp. Root157]KQZ81897.1 hypothetical protein ASD64_09075 [Mesorhizobium sp. Root157]
MIHSETEALKWLADHGGDGVFAGRDHQALLARGETAPFMRSTWNALASQGLVEFYGKRRCRLPQPERNPS